MPRMVCSQDRCAPVEPPGSRFSPLQCQTVGHRPVRAELPDTDERVRSGRPFRTSPSTFNANRQSAHRTAERGIRFIHFPHCVWDHHNEIRTLLPKSCGSVNQGSAALLNDLKQRGLVQGTSITWCGGVRQNSNVTGDGPGFMGRDHYDKGCLMRMAGGIKGGFSCGAAGRSGQESSRGRDGCTRPARGDRAPDRHRPRHAHVPLPRVRLPAAGGSRQGREREPGVDRAILGSGRFPVGSCRASI